VSAQDDSVCFVQFDRPHSHQAPPLAIEDVKGKEVRLELARELTGSLAYGSFFGSWSAKLVNELGCCSKRTQDMLPTYGHNPA
jgi:hypothetical protein